MTPQQLGATLKKIRLEKGMTQEDLVELTGLQQEAISRMETGSNYPSIGTFLKVVEALDATFIVQDGQLVYTE